MTLTTPNDVDLGCYLYGIAGPELVVPADLEGVGGQIVTVVPHRDVAAVISLADRDRSVAGRDDLLAHGRVLDTVAAAGPVIPVRFGAVLLDREALERDVLKPGHDRYRALLAELSGHSQFTVRARYDERQVLTEVVAENPAIAQLRAATRDRPDVSSYADRVRLGELVAGALEAKSAQDGHRLLTALEPHATAVNVRDSAGLDRLLDVAVLVKDAGRAAFERTVEGLANEFAGRARLKLIGPTAPYDFVTTED
ncbi:GvpL/GvpF family gas vesicle protein [Kribbella sp. NPDC004875]|uniref:GvpL/GvpF family gas vesicle protein n=1 Tax=Kribbella sp. NPDC004875 TaxID=3364107 RepID=UPI0036B4E2EC